MNAFDVIIIGFGKGGKTLAAELQNVGGKSPLLNVLIKCMEERVSISAVFRQRRWFIRLKLLPVWKTPHLKKEVRFIAMLLL